MGLPAVITGNASVHVSQPSSYADLEPILIGLNGLKIDQAGMREQILPPTQKR